MNAVLESRYIVTRREVETLISVRWGYSYTIEAATGLTDTLEFSVRGEFDTEAHKERADNIRKGRRDRSLGLILNTLAADGVIPAGTYTIKDQLPPISEKKWSKGELKVIGVSC